MKMRQVGRSKEGVRGQSTLEYMLIIAAVLGVLIVGINSLTKPAIEKTVSDSAAVIQESSGKLKSGLGL